MLTMAPVDYDYGVTRTLLTGVEDRYGATYRLIEIDQSGRGSFAQGQVQRYASGMYSAIDMTNALDLENLGLPGLTTLLAEAREAESVAARAAVLVMARKVRDEPDTAIGVVRTLASVISSVLDSDHKMAPRARKELLTALGVNMNGDAS
ncbi:MAG: hypothetical protein DRJ42_28130 [Deltaproteobacteria bacterium]|nr:MAG: hypothetical protein DRJ42_28130 [Deltaproteobacteria bacterium]